MRQLRILRRCGTAKAAELRYTPSPQDKKDREFVIPWSKEETKQGRGEVREKRGKGEARQERDGAEKLTIYFGLYVSDKDSVRDIDCLHIPSIFFLSDHLPHLPSRL